MIKSLKGYITKTELFFATVYNVALNTVFAT